MTYPQCEPARSAVFLFGSAVEVLAKTSFQKKEKVANFSKSVTISFEPSFPETEVVSVFGIAGEASKLSFLLFVYLKSMYTRLVVVVNAGTFLWISPYFLL